jgi:hypothetical protein
VNNLFANNLFGALKFIEHPLIPSELPVITFDPQHKCTWATPAYRAEVNAWLLSRFGTQRVAFMFDPRAAGLVGGPVMAFNPKHAVMLKDFR